MVSVSDRSVVDELAEKSVRPLDGGIDFLVLNATFFGKHQRQETGQSRLVERTITS